MNWASLLQDWRFWVILSVIIILMWVARPWAHRFLRAIFFGFAYMLNRLQLWFMQSGEAIYLKYSETVAALRTEEYEEKLYAHEAKLGKRATSHGAEIVNVAGQIELSAADLDAAVQDLASADIRNGSAEAVREAMYEGGDARSGARANKAAAEVRRSVTAKVQEIRPALARIRAEIPALTKAAEQLRETGRTFERSTARINSDFQAFEEAVHSPDRLAVAAKQSIVVPWLIATLVMLIALTGVFLNFFLIQRPMAEIVGDDVQIFGVGVPTFAALVVILLEAATGILLMDTAGLTNLLKLQNISKRTRQILFVTAFVFLLGFSAFEALLAIQRDVLIALDMQTQAMARGEEFAPDADGMSLTMIAQVILAMLIPWLLALAAIPLETFIGFLWLILQLVAHQSLVMISVLFRILSTVFKSVGVFLLRLYDLIIFLPLAIEQMVRVVRRQPAASDPPYAYAEIHAEEIQRPASPPALPDPGKIH